jgi:hypothetical protein
VPQVVHAQGEVDPARLDRGEPHPGAEGVAGDRGADGGGEQGLVPADPQGLDVERDGFEPVVVDAEGAGFVVLGVGLDHVAPAGGGVLLLTRRESSRQSRVRESPRARFCCLMSAECLRTLRRWER